MTIPEARTQLEALRTTRDATIATAERTYTQGAAALLVQLLGESSPAPAAPVEPPKPAAPAVNGKRRPVVQTPPAEPPVSPVVEPAAMTSAAAPSPAPAVDPEPDAAPAEDPGPPCPHGKPMSSCPDCIF